MKRSLTSVKQICVCVRFETLIFVMNVIDIFVARRTGDSNLCVYFQILQIQIIRQ